MGRKNKNKNKNRNNEGQKKVKTNEWAFDSRVNKSLYVSSLSNDLFKAYYQVLVIFSNLQGIIKMVFSK